MRLEPELWSALEDICGREGIDVNELVKRAEEQSHRGSRTSAVRVYIVSYLRKKAFESGATPMSDEVHDKG